MKPDEARILKARIEARIEREQRKSYEDLLELQKLCEHDRRLPIDNCEACGASPSSAVLRAYDDVRLFLEYKLQAESGYVGMYWRCPGCKHREFSLELGKCPKCGWAPDPEMLEMDRTKDFIR